ncbi:hypothetical protein CRG98_029403 [Punica granatum]|uniref:Uncharacterized protein n=1 Tax=Punica granatum TaxID=22663 RepID=A0A2I0J2S7_PUNGR|nr:hypothetical protein CRG98_029403 [Punica granatum]
MYDGTVRSRVGLLSYQVDLYNPAKITKNRAHPRNRPDWAVFGSDITTVAPDSSLTSRGDYHGRLMKRVSDGPDLQENRKMRQKIRSD